MQSFVERAAHAVEEHILMNSNKKGLATPRGMCITAKKAQSCAANGVGRPCIRPDGVYVLKKTKNDAVIGALMLCDVFKVNRRDE